jgi:two-component system OmpR family sensor kinase
MKKTISLQKYLTFGLTLGIVVLWLAAMGLSALVVQHELNEMLDTAMEETAQRLLPLAVRDIVNREDTSTPQRVAPLQTEQAGFTYLVRDHDGTILLQSFGADLAVFGSRPINGFASTPTHRVYGASALRATVFIEVAEPLAHRRDLALDTVIALALPLLFLIPVCLFGVWLLVRISLRSILSYGRAIEERGAGNLSSIVVEKLPTEIDPIADAVNHLLERLRLALESERRFTANSAHELRTPLATTLAQVQRLRQAVSEGPLRVRVQEIEASLKELSRLSEKLMQLAKAEGGGLLSDVPQDLAMLLAHVVQDVRRTTSAPIELILPPAESALSMIDPDAFAILVRNLIENALKHGAPNCVVEVSLSKDALLKVVNAGAIVEAADLAQLTRRFVRGGSRTEGFGLGLAIASAIASGVGAKWLLASPATGKKDGFEVSVQFVRSTNQAMQ